MVQLNGIGIGLFATSVVFLGLGVTLLVYAAHTVLSLPESPLYFPIRQTFATLLCAASVVLSFSHTLQITATILNDVVAYPLDDLLSRFAQWLSTLALVTAVGHRHLSLRPTAEQRQIYATYWASFATLISCDFAACLGWLSLELGSSHSSADLEDTIMKHLAFASDVVLDISIFIMIIYVNQVSKKSTSTHDDWFDQFFLRPAQRILCPLLLAQAGFKIALYLVPLFIHFSEDHQKILTLVHLSTLGSLQFAIIAVALHLSRRDPPKPRLSVYSIRHNIAFEKSGDDETTPIKPTLPSPPESDSGMRDSEETMGPDSPLIHPSIRTLSMNSATPRATRYPPPRAPTEDDAFSMVSASAYSTDVETLHDESKLPWIYRPVNSMEPPSSSLPRSLSVSTKR